MTKQVKWSRCSQLHFASTRLKITFNRMQPAHEYIHFQRIYLSYFFLLPSSLNLHWKGGHTLMTRDGLWLHTSWQMGPTVDYNFFQPRRQWNINTQGLRTSFFKPDVPRAARYLHSGVIPTSDAVWPRLCFLAALAGLRSQWGVLGLVVVGKRADSCLFRAPQRVSARGKNCPGVQVNTEEAEKRVAGSPRGESLFTRSKTDTTHSP